MPLAFYIGFLSISWSDILDITLVAVLFFNVYKLIKGSVALRVVIGFLSLYFIFLLVKATEMKLLSEILGQFMNVGVFIAVILFQQEIRKFLLLVGKTTNLKDSPFLNLFKFGNPKESNQIEVSPILEAMKSLGGTNTGALIVVSNSPNLKFFEESGDILEAQISKRILISIFFKNSPLHDGAAIIHGNRIVAARCILPISENKDIPADLGMRHRAAIGMTEATDSVVLVVSEETGQLSFVEDGVIFHNSSIMQIRKKLNDYLAQGNTKIEITAQNNEKLQ